MDNLKQSDIGKEFTCIIQGRSCIGKIQLQGSTYYLCQDEKTGLSCQDKLGYNNSWEVGDGTTEYIIGQEVSELVILEQIMEIY